MNCTWINALGQLNQDGTPAMMITVVDEQGSTPRNAGAKMLVTADDQHDTIGGGHLEYKAIKIARELLKEKIGQPRLERFSLGASLGQCCGGATTLLFEPLGTQTTQIALFGAGHVGQALVNILATLPCRVRWIDERDEQFPAQVPDNVDKVVNEFPVDEVAEMPADSYFIVMTHNHQLDQELTEAILERDDFAYYGLIGSMTKRKKFEHRLKAKGFNDAQLDKMVCPMGIEAVKGKLPAEIAVSVAGEVISHYNAEFGAHKNQTPALSNKNTSVVDRLAV